jgi:hypothetical protein
VRIDAADAIELNQLLRFVGDWLAADPDRLGTSLHQFVGSPGYDPTHLQADLNRFTFLLGGHDGQPLFGGIDAEPSDQPQQTPSRGRLGPGTLQGRSSMDEHDSVVGLASRHCRVTPVGRPCASAERQHVGVPAAHHLPDGCHAAL